MTILERLRAATGPDRELDLAIGEYWPEPRPFTLTLLQQRGGKPTVYRFTARIDAAVALVERMLPEWQIYIGIMREANGGCVAQVAPNQDATMVKGKTAPLAILTALFTANEAKERT